MTTNWVSFIGVVEDIDDPKLLGRVKVRVFGQHDQDTIPTADLDWATPIVPVMSATKQGVGISPTGLLVGSMVIGFYMDGDTRAMPMILGSFPKIPDGDESKHDVSKRARGINDIENKEVGPEPAPDFAAKYPHNKTITTEGGHLIEIDDTPGAERILARHKTGSYVEINKDGRVVIKSVNDQYIISQNDSAVYSKGNMTTQSDGNMTIKVKGTAKIDVTGECTIKSASLITLTAPKVNLMG
jgi:hypothetical protein